MHLPTLLKKAVYAFSGKLFLSDPVRNRTYRWAWGHLRSLPKTSLVVDVGSRDSLFPAFLAWRGHVVKVVERDARFTVRQIANSRRWGVRVMIDNCDFLAPTIDRPCDAICSLFSLQHAGDDDIAAYRLAARLLRSGGLLLSATEYRHEGTRFKFGCDDSAMQIYSPDDIEKRIEAPLFREGMIEYDRHYLLVTKEGKVKVADDTPGKSSIVLLLFRKE